MNWKSVHSWERTKKELPDDIKKKVPREKICTKEKMFIYYGGEMAEIEIFLSSNYFSGKLFNTTLSFRLVILCGRKL